MKPLISKDVYLKEVLENTPRLLSLMNRNLSSKSYGCFDRQYWHYNTVDFPCAEYQESVLTLAFLYTIEYEGNPYFQSESILEWINGGLDFWRRIQHKNGSYAEWYPNENSMSVTPFSTYAVSETLLMLKGKIRDGKKVESCLEKAATWLLNHEDLRATNHYSGSTAALYNLYLLTGKRLYKEASQRIASSLTKLQKEEGWFMEYNGADIGYTSVTLYYLANYFKVSKDETILPMISKAIDFIYYFLHPDGTFGGEYGSRNTEYLIPYCFEILAESFPKAAVIACEIRNSLSQKKHVSLNTFDDRYLCYLSYMYIQAYSNLFDNMELQESVPYKKNFVKYFVDAGLRIVSTSSFYCVQNLKKGGAFKLDSKKQNASSFFDSGIVVEDNRGKAYYSFYLGDENKSIVNCSKLSVSRKLAGIPFNILTPFRNIFQRIFLLTIGKNEWIESKVKDLLRNLLITNLTLSEFSYTREIELTEIKCIVTDKINKIKDVKRLIVGLQASYIYGPSTRYFQPSDLRVKPIILTKADLFKYRSFDRLKIIREFDQSGSLLSVNIHGE